ncbi:MAG: SIR2 family protein [Actinomycetota bacterium]|nr:SIR2 family protein [Actinomycetota bacterium]
MGASSPSSSGVLAVDDFVRRVMSQGRNLHWLAGAGVSLSAGVPTAWDMTYDFKRTVYAQARRIEVTDLDASDPDVQLRLDAYFAAQASFPPPGDPEEYAVFFERVHADAAGRQRKIAQLLDEADPQPNLGHVILAVMWQLQLLHVVWTTNFDDVLEQAAALVSGAPRWLRRADRSEPALVKAVFEDQAKPLLVKMHGDFQSERLDNTVDELRADNELRAGLREAMRTKGLVVVGYSGRDTSVMQALRDALDADYPFTAGLYWVAKTGDRLLPRVTDLLDAARAKGVQAYLVECPSFEELMGAVRYLLPATDDQKALFNRFQPPTRLSEFDIPARGGRWPRLRLNAVAVAAYPNTSRLVLCEIGNTREVRSAVAAAGVDVVAARRHDGVVAFGRDDDLLRAFDEWDPKLDYGRLDPGYSADIGLLYDALAIALARERPLVRRGRRTLIIDPSQPKHPVFEPLRGAGMSSLVGRIPGTNGSWAESIEMRLEQRHGTLWLVYAPSVWSDRCDDKAENDRRREWTRQRQVKRYNRPYTAILKGWVDVLCSSSKEAQLRTLGIERGGTDAEFVLKRLAPYAERGTS